MSCLTVFKTWKLWTSKRGPKNHPSFTKPMGFIDRIQCCDSHPYLVHIRYHPAALVNKNSFIPKLSYLNWEESLLLVGFLREMETSLKGQNLASSKLTVDQFTRMADNRWTTPVWNFIWLVFDFFNDSPDLIRIKPNSGASIPLPFKKQLFIDFTNNVIAYLTWFHKVAQFDKCIGIAEWSTGGNPASWGLIVCGRLTVNRSLLSICPSKSLDSPRWMISSPSEKETSSQTASWSGLLCKENILAGQITPATRLVEQRDLAHSPQLKLWKKKTVKG